MNQPIDISKLGIHPKPSGVTTRGGLAVRIYAVDGSGSFSIHGAMAGDDGEWFLTSWVPLVTPDSLSIIPAPARFNEERWINVWRDGGVIDIGATFATWAEADRSARNPDGTMDPARIACIRITITGVDGDGL